MSLGSRRVIKTSLRVRKSTTVTLLSLPGSTAPTRFGSSDLSTRLFEANVFFQRSFPVDQTDICRLDRAGLTDSPKEALGIINSQMAVGIGHHLRHGS